MKSLNTMLAEFGRGKDKQPRKRKIGLGMRLAMTKGALTGGMKGLKASYGTGVKTEQAGKAIGKMAPDIGTKLGGKIVEAGMKTGAMLGAASEGLKYQGKKLAKKIKKRFD